MRKRYQKPQTRVIHLDEQMTLLAGTGDSHTDVPSNTVATAARGWAKESAWGAWSESDEFDDW